VFNAIILVTFPPFLLSAGPGRFGFHDLPQRLLFVFFPFFLFRPPPGWCRAPPIVLFPFRLQLPAPSTPGHDCFVRSRAFSHYFFFIDVPWAGFWSWVLTPALASSPATWSPAPPGLMSFPLQAGPFEPSPPFPPPFLTCVQVWGSSSIPPGRSLSGWVPWVGPFLLFRCCRSLRRFRLVVLLISHGWVPVTPRKCALFSKKLPLRRDRISSYRPERFQRSFSPDDSPLFLVHYYLKDFKPFQGLTFPGSDGRHRGLWSLALTTTIFGLVSSPPTGQMMVPF